MTLILIALPLPPGKLDAHTNTTRMSIRVWVRLASQSREEAIKLILPREGSDVSDVLLQVPAALNVSGFRPSELALHLAQTDDMDGDTAEVVHEAPLSNRTALQSLLREGQQSTELNMVVRPKNGGDDIATLGVVSRPVHSQRPAVPAGRTKATPSGMGAPSASNLFPPQVPKHSTVTASVRAASPYRRTASATSATSRTASPSVAARSGSVPRASSVPRGSSAQRETSAPRVTSTHQPSTVRPVGTSTSTRQSLTSASSRTSSPRVMPPPPPARVKPSVVGGQGAAATPRQVHPLVPSCATRSRKPTSLQQSDTATAASSLQAPISAGVCATFKPQWGNVLCATCKHSKQAHAIKLRQQQRQEEKSRLSGLSLLESTPVRHQRVDPAHMGGVHPSEDSFLHPSTHRTLSTSPAPSSIGNRSDMNLLDPPVVGNLSLGSPCS